MQLKKGKDIVEVGLKEVVPNLGVPNLGVVAATGKVASEVVKQTAGMATLPRLALIGSAAFVTETGTSLGLNLAKSSMDNKKINTEIENEAAKLDETDNSGSNSPSDFGGGFINAVLEDNEIPLIAMVNGLSYLNYIEFSLILSLFSLLFRKYFSLKLIKFFLKLKKKYNFTKKVYNINEDNLNLNKVFNTFDKYTDFLIVFIFICLFWIMFINIYFSVNLAENIDSYVNVYNYIKKNSFLFLIVTIKKPHIYIKNNLILYNEILKKII
jgi:hypothetical protein